MAVLFATACIEYYRMALLSIGFLGFYVTLTDNSGSAEGWEKAGAGMFGFLRAILRIKSQIGWDAPHQSALRTASPRSGEAKEGDDLISHLR